MKVALVHELLTLRGGAERVLRIFADMFPDAPIYTLLYDEKKFGGWFPKTRVRTSRLQKKAEFLNHSPFSIFHSPFDHHLFLSRFPSAVEEWDFSGFDFVLSSSSAFAHGIITNSAPRHLCYVNSPARYLWDRTHDVLGRAGKGLLGPLKHAYLSRLFHRLRIWDSEAADRPDALIAASREVRRRIELYWRRDSEVIHPPIDDFWFESKPISTRNYYLIVSQLTPYKRLDLAIRACNERNARLVIAGEGSARSPLEAIAGPTVEFAGYRTDEELRDLYAGARATIFPGREDFGLVPLESLACGTPVIAYRAGGATETLTDEVAEFFDDQDEAGIVVAMEKAECRKWNGGECRERAREFSGKNFDGKIRDAVSRLV